ncbi:MAG: hypothetical protein MI740_07695 [Halanaerobiales bacterium]|nr:hypothetical protein [Halanaerobiales bacterium]
MKETLSKSSINWKTVLLMGFAYASLNIGSGFSSGQVPLQNFVSGGGMWTIITPFFPIIVITIFTAWAFNTGRIQSFDNPSEGFEFYCGKTGAKILDVFTLIVLGVMTTSMYAGSGAAINQYFGLPVYVGATFLGAVTVVVVCMGLERVKDVLGFIGIALVAFIVITSINSFITADVGIMEAQKNIPQYVAEGKVIQPGLFGFKNPFVSPFYYLGCCIITSFPFVIALGKKNIKSTKEAIASGLSAGFFFSLAILLISYTIALNIDYIVANGVQVPMLTAISKNMPVLAFIFTIVIICSIFTTVTGFLWSFARRFAEDKTTKQRTIVIAITLIGVFTGSIIPFNKFVSVVYPASGVGGIVLFIYMLIHHIRYLFKRSKIEAKA